MMALKSTANLSHTNFMDHYIIQRAHNYQRQNCQRNTVRFTGKFKKEYNKKGLQGLATDPPAVQHSGTQNSAHTCVCAVPRVPLQQQLGQGSTELGHEVADAQ